jgi:16S rRNA (uracil1498-N3)-methyltransferase
MRLTRVYVDAPLSTGRRVTLEGSAASHLIRVLRLKSGEGLTLFNGQGGEHAATIAEAKSGRLTVEVGELSASERESPLVLTLAQGVSRGERMDLVVQKATELGASRIVPLLTERSVVRLSAPQAARKLEHWRAIAIGACEQSGRNRLPELVPPLPLAEFLRAAGASDRAAGAADTAGASRLLLSPEATMRIGEVPRPAHSVTVLIGPEGGLADAEQEAAVAAGFVPVGLGPRVLRTETAAIAALALLQRQLGDL